MFLIIGSVIVVASTFGGFAALGGHLGVIWQPFEIVIIFGSAAGAYLIANPSSVLKGSLGAVKACMKGSAYSKDSYVELLGVLYQVFKLVKMKGNLELEVHIETPDESPLFQAFPNFAKDHTALQFLCDYLRMITLGADDPNDLETLMDEEIETHHHEHSQIAETIQTVADGMPALGVVAAVLGVIHTMGSITEPPEILGHLIGGALVGTFLGVWIAYGFIAPIACKAKSTYNAELKYLQCIKVALLAHLRGSAPTVSVEFARKALLSYDRPSFYELEEAVEALPPIT